jgi:hypothetical protein
MTFTFSIRTFNFLHEDIQPRTFILRTFVIRALSIKLLCITTLIITTLIIMIFSTATFNRTTLSKVSYTSFILLSETRSCKLSFFEKNYMLFPFCK